LNFHLKVIDTHHDTNHGKRIAQRHLTRSLLFVGGYPYPVTNANPGRLTGGRND